MDFDITQLRPADVLLYHGSGIVSRLIRRKTNADAIFGSGNGPTHCELFIGDGMTFASRDWVGVNFYPLRTNGLVAVLRPEPGPSADDMTRGLANMKAMQGEKYDFDAIFGFFRLGPTRDERNHEEICSEALTRALRALKIEPFQGDIPAACVSPIMFWLSPRLTRLWKISDAPSDHESLAGA